MINGFNPITPASRPYRGYNPGPVRRHDDDRFRGGPRMRQPMPYYPQPIFPPRAYYPAPRPYFPQPYPYYPQPSVASQVWHGATERLAELGQVVLHPFNRYARRMPYDAFMPRTQAENVGRWIVNGGLLAGALFAGSAMFGGLGLGGAGAGVGLG